MRTASSWLGKAIESLLIDSTTFSACSRSGALSVVRVARRPRRALAPPARDEREAALDQQGAQPLQEAVDLGAVDRRQAPRAGLAGVRSRPRVAAAARVGAVDHGLLAGAEDLDLVPAPVRLELEAALGDLDAVLRLLVEEEQLGRPADPLRRRPDVLVREGHDVADERQQRVVVDVDVDGRVVGRQQADVAAAALELRDDLVPVGLEVAPPREALPPPLAVVALDGPARHLAAGLGRDVRAGWTSAPGGTTGRMCVKASYHGKKLGSGRAGSGAVGTAGSSGRRVHRIRVDPEASRSARVGIAGLAGASLTRTIGTVILDAIVRLVMIRRALGLPIGRPRHRLVVERRKIVPIHHAASPMKARRSSSAPARCGPHAHPSRIGLGTGQGPAERALPRM